MEYSFINCFFKAICLLTTGIVNILELRNVWKTKVSGQALTKAETSHCLTKGRDYKNIYLITPCHCLRVGVIKKVKF